MNIFVYGVCLSKDYVKNFESFDDLYITLMKNNDDIYLFSDNIYSPKEKQKIIVGMMISDTIDMSSITPKEAGRVLKENDRNIRIIKESMINYINEKKISGLKPSVFIVEEDNIYLN
jgi:hypothetical protein